MNDRKEAAINICGELYTDNKMSYPEYLQVVDAIYDFDTLKERDEELEALWEKFGDVPMNPDTEKIEEPFLSFPVGTDREDIWHWFDERHSKGISYLLYGTPFYEKNDEGVYPLLEFVKLEVPFRLKEIFHLPDDKLEPSVVNNIIWSLYDHSDVMLAYDSMDEFLRNELVKCGISPDDYEEEKNDE